VSGRRTPSYGGGADGPGRQERGLHPHVQEACMAGKNRKGGSSGNQQTGQNNKGKGKGK
jgi:hypothetical protein